MKTNNYNTFNLTFSKSELHHVIDCLTIACSHIEEEVLDDTTGDFGDSVKRHYHKKVGEWYSLIEELEEAKANSILLARARLEEAKKNG
tara:strand:- start:978 stop:1244 length:267 start_codon:yes stop_codon:yes gene_type:complete